MNDYQMFVHANDSEAVTPAQLALAERSRDRIDALLGPAPAGGHAVQRGGSGPCRICGVTAPLTFEHVPPRSSGNRNRRRALDVGTALIQPGLDMPSSGWVQMQRGAGDYVTCAACNSFSGTEYVPAYSDAVAAAVVGLQQWVGSLPDDEKPPEALRFRAGRHFQPGAVIRQALFMLMAMSGSAGLSNAYPDLRRIVLDKARIPLPADIRVRLTLVIPTMSSRYRSTAIMGDVDWSEGQERVLIDVSHVPFGWLAEIGPASSRPARDVSSWTEIDPADLVEIDRVLPVGSVATAAPGDYRHAWQIPTEAH